MSFRRFGLAACALFIGATALDSIAVPADITAGTNFTLTVTPSDNDSGSYRVYLDTSPPGYAGGQSCYLKNSTSIDTTNLSLTIPPNFGPDGDFYSISTREISTDDSKYIKSNAFNLTGATGNWSMYEDKLNGAPLWDANSLPCSSYNCARTCAENSYPDDLTSGSDAYNTMSACIMKCPGVSEKTSSSASSAATSTQSGSGSSASATGSVVSNQASSASGSAAATASHTGAASSNFVPASFVAAAGIMAFLL